MSQQRHALPLPTCGLNNMLRKTQASSDLRNQIGSCITSFRFKGTSSLQKAWETKMKRKELKERNHQNSISVGLNRLHHWKEDYNSRLCFSLLDSWKYNNENNVNNKINIQQTKSLKKKKKQRKKALIIRWHILQPPISNLLISSDPALQPPPPGARSSASTWTGPPKNSWTTIGIWSTTAFRFFPAAKMKNPGAARRRDDDVTIIIVTIDITNISTGYYYY